MENEVNKIAVIGSGYVGTTTAAFLANSGYEVVALDIDSKKVDTLNRGKSPFYEVGLDELLSSGVNKKTLLATASYEEAINDADIVISCVGTPDNPDGSSNLEYVFSAAKTAAPFLKDNAVYVQKSTVPVGTGRKVIDLLPTHVNYISNPEFLREGTAVYDTLLFDRIIVGGENEDALKKVQDLYRSIQNSASEISEICGGIAGDKVSEHSGKYISTTLESAELIKVTANAFLALKISFANSIAKLSDETGADVNGVMDGIGADKRIGRAFLNAGRGYGGGCFPKDVSGLISSSLEYGVDMPIMRAATDVNESMAGYIVEKVKKQLGTLSGKKIAVLGLAFKPGTSDARKSPAVKIANMLEKEGANVTAYDPEAMSEARENLNKEITLKSTIDKAIEGVEIICVATGWPVFKNLDEWLNKSESCKIIIDCMNCIDEKVIIDSGRKYIGVGRIK